VVGVAVATMARLARGTSCRTAGDRFRLVPARLSPVLDMEEATSHRPFDDHFDRGRIREIPTPNANPLWNDADRRSLINRSLRHRHHTSQWSASASSWQSRPIYSPLARPLVPRSPLFPLESWGLMTAVNVKTRIVSKKSIGLDPTGHRRHGDRVSSVIDGEIGCLS